MAYGDCGTGGSLDVALGEFGVDRLDGAHCYEFLAGKKEFEELMADQPGTFFLTDSLTRNFRRWIWEGLGLDRNPELRKTYFANYHRLVYLSQSATDQLVAKAKEAATLLGLEFEQVSTGLEPISSQIRLKLGIER